MGGGEGDASGGRVHLHLRAYPEANANRACVGFIDQTGLGRGGEVGLLNEILCRDTVAE